MSDTSTHNIACASLHVVASLTLCSAANPSAYSAPRMMMSARPSEGAPASSSRGPTELRPGSKESNGHARKAADAKLVGDLVAGFPFAAFHIWQFLACAGTYAACASTDALMPWLAQSMRANIPIDTVQEGLLTSTTYWGMALGSLLSGIIADVLGRRTAVCAGLGLLALLQAGIAAISTFWPMALCFFLRGLVYILVVGIAKMQLAECIPAAHRGLLLNLIHSVWQMGAIAGTAYTYRSTCYHSLALMSLFGPAAAFALALLASVESPMWLMRARGRAAAERSLRDIASACKASALPTPLFVASRWRDMQPEQDPQCALHAAAGSAATGGDKQGGTCNGSGRGIGKDVEGDVKEEGSGDAERTAALHHQDHSEGSVSEANGVWSDTGSRLDAMELEEGASGSSPTHPWTHRTSRNMDHAVQTASSGSAAALDDGRKGSSRSVVSGDEVDTQQPPNEQRALRAQSSQGSLVLLLSHSLREFFTSSYISAKWCAFCARRSTRRLVLEVGLVWFVLTFASLSNNFLLIRFLSQTGRTDLQRPLRLTLFGSKLLGGILGACVVDYIGRKRVFAPCFVITALGTLSLSAARSTACLYASVAVLQVSNEVLWATLMTFTVEAFSTEMRASALGFCIALGRVGASISVGMGPRLMDEGGPALPFEINALALLVGAGLSLCVLPAETSGVALR